MANSANSIVYYDFNGSGGNAFAVLGRTMEALRKLLKSQGKGNGEISMALSEYMQTARSADYQSLLDHSVKVLVDAGLPEYDDDASINVDLILAENDRLKSLLKRNGINI